MDIRRGNSRNANKKQKYILESLTNGAALSGFALYEIDGDEIVQIEYSASATGAGEDHLIDTNKDGFYDGYVQNRYSYDVLISMYQAFISGTVRVLYLTRPK